MTVKSQLSGAIFKAEVTTARSWVFIAVFSVNWMHYVHFLCCFSNLNQMVNLLSCTL